MRYYSALSHRATSRNREATTAWKFAAGAGLSTGNPSPGKEVGNCEQAPAPLWYPVTVTARKHGGSLSVSTKPPVRSAQRPDDDHRETRGMQAVTRYFSSIDEAHRVINVIQSLDIRLERVRGSVTQGDVKVFINGEYILNFADNIVLPERGYDPELFFGEDIGGWVSSEPDSSFVLALFWNPFAYRHAEKICTTLGIKPEEWIEN